jgi:putative glutamine amidotransferase
MKRPVVGIIANAALVNNEFPVQATGMANVTAIADVAGAMPLLIPSLARAMDIPALLGLCDGFLFTGGRPNVHPKHYGEEATPAHGAFDEERDAVTLPLIRLAVDRAVPILGICRGFQEFNVAFGGSLHPEIRDLPGRLNHRMPPDAPIAEKFAHRHSVTFTPGGIFARMLGAEEVMVNSLHGQGIKTCGPRIRIEGLAPDGTEEALVVDGAPGFALAVQWHPEWNAAEDRVSRPLFSAFGAALVRRRKAA